MSAVAWSPNLHTMVKQMKTMDASLLENFIKSLSLSPVEETAVKQMFVEKKVAHKIASEWY